MKFDYGASAELFMPKRKGGSRPPLDYRRFATAAEANAAQHVDLKEALPIGVSNFQKRFDLEDTEIVHKNVCVGRFSPFRWIASSVALWRKSGHRPKRPKRRF